MLDKTGTLTEGRPRVVSATLDDESLRLAAALEIDICNLLRDARSRRHEETASILGDPFLAELAPYIAQMDSLQRSMFLNQVRDLALGRRRSA